MGGEGGGVSEGRGNRRRGGGQGVGGGGGIRVGEVKKGSEQGVWEGERVVRKVETALTDRPLY